VIRRRRKTEPLPQYHHHSHDFILAQLKDEAHPHEFVKDIGACRQEFTAVPDGEAFLVDVDDALGRLDRWL
jgi:hypothetical protein